MKIHRDKRIFKQRPLKRKSFLDWIFKKNVDENSIIELTNAIVNYGRPAAVPQSIIDGIHSKYNFNIYNRFTREVAPVYMAFVRQVFSGLANTELTQDDVDDIVALQTMFQIPDDSIARLKLKVGATIYHDALRAALADSILSEREKDGLLHLRRQLDLDENTMHTLYNQSLCDLIQKKVEDALKDGELSPDEEADINETCERFDIDISYKANTERAIHRAKKIWQIRHAPLLPISVDIQLKRGESCFALFDASWLEVRRATAMPYHPRYKILSDNSEIASSYAPIVEDCLTEIDAGQLFLTNKRMIFVGKGMTTTIPFSKILRIEQFREGIKVHKETGRSPYLVSRKSLSLGTLATRLLAGA